MSLHIVPFGKVVIDSWHEGAIGGGFLFFEVLFSLHFVLSFKSKVLIF